MPRGRPRKNPMPEVVSESYQIENMTTEQNEFQTEVNVEEVNFGDIVSQSDSETKFDKEVKYTPIDPEWTDYVLSYLKPNEFQKGFPTVHGIRRLVEKFVGKIIESKSEVLQVPSQDNGYHSTVVHNLEIDLHNNNSRISINGACDLYKDIAKPPFDKFIVASCDSRAEGKALRRALQINTVSAEEVAGEDQTVSRDEPITSTQISMIDTVAQRNDINIEKFVKSEFNVKSINEVNKEQASTLCSKISEYQRLNDTIPAEIKGYVSSWKNDFSKGDK